MPDSQTVLIVDDQENIRQLVRTFLERHQYQVVEASDGKSLFQQLDNHNIDLIILDLMLPDIYGIDACKKIRETSQIPIIMLTAMQGEVNTVLGFEAGTDDYMEKPFSAQVLLSRIQAVLKRSEATQELRVETIQRYKKASFANWTYLPERACVCHTQGRHVFLTKNECLLLQLFLEHQEVVLSRDKIAHALNLSIDENESRAIDVQVSRLRTKLKDKTQSSLIRSIRNKGYLMTVPVRLH